MNPPVSTPDLKTLPADAESPAELLASVKPDHPALERLAARRIAAQPVEAAITSYDRMHHRHSRA
ncbi:MAG: YhhA family cyclophane-containing RiPP [Solirubrobacteraceae bacterium]